jgi:ketosteroid isomerase-like protein
VKAALIVSTRVDSEARLGVSVSGWISAQADLKETHGRETQVYRKMADGWRLVHVHYSGMPVAEKEKGF